MNTRRYYDDSNLYFLSKLQLEINLCRTLRKLNRTVIYRPHPDRLGFVEKVMRDEVNSLSVGQLSVALQNVGTIIFSHPTTSTLGPALRGNKNIILLLEKDRVAWTSRGLNLLGKRCRLLKNSRDEHGVPTINPYDIEAALEFDEACRDMRMNQEFVEFYWD